MTEDSYNRIFAAIQASEERQADRLDGVREELKGLRSDFKELDGKVDGLISKHGRFDGFVEAKNKEDEKRDKIIEELRAEVGRLKTQAEITSMKIAGIISAGGLLGMVLEEILKAVLKH